MTSTDLVVERVVSGRRLNTFVDLSWSIYADQPHWVAPLKREFKFYFSPRHPFAEHGRMALFMARRGRRPVGRIVGIVDDYYIEYQNEKVAFFGFFECHDDLAAARALFDQVRAWAREQGFALIRGPFSPSTNDPLGVLVEGFDDPPAVYMPYNPPYYHDLVINCGLKPCKTVYAQKMEVHPELFDIWRRRTERLYARLA